MVRRFAAALAIPLVVGAGAGTPRVPSRDWKRAQTANFVAIGNASDGELRDTLRQLEAFRAALGVLFPGLATKSGVPTQLVVLKNLQAVGEFAPRDARNKKLENIAGYFTDTPRGEMFVMGVSGGPTTLQTAYHEYVHSLIHHRMHELPTWVDEGVSDLYSTFEIDNKGFATIGRVPAWRRETLREQPLIPLEEIVTPEGATRIMTARRDRVPIFYAEAWAFVHFLAFSNAGHRSGQLGVYLSELGSGRSPDTAFQDAFGGTYRQLEDQLRGYLRLGLPGVRVSVASLLGPADKSSIDVQPVSVAQAEGTQGCVLVYTGSAGEAERHLKNALADDPSDVQARGCFASVRIAQGQHNEAREILEPLVASSPDAANEYTLGLEYRLSGRFEDAISAFSKATTMKPDLVPAWYQLSLATLHLHRDAQSNAALEQVVGRGDFEALRHRASEALTMDRADVTVRDVGRYVAQHGDENGVYAAFLGAIAFRRMDQPQKADALLASVASAVDPKSWTGRVMAFMQGTLDAKSLMDAAHDNGERTEAHTYIGFGDVQAGRIDEAKAHFQWVRDHGSRNYTEYPLAVGELRRLGS